MFCVKCGEAIPDNSKFCPLCGENLADLDQQTVVYASQEEIGYVPKKINLSKNIVRILSGVFVLIVIMLAVLGVQKNNLKKELQKEWYDSDGTIIKVLEFSDKKVEYRLETGYRWMNTTLFNDDYKVVSGNKIKVQMFGDDWDTYTIKFNDKKTVMTISPAITNTNSSENWYYID